MRASEWVAAVYFGYMLAVALARPAWPSRRRAAAVSVAWLGAVSFVAGLAGVGVYPTLRNWTPIVYLVAGYWLSGLYFIAPMPAAERALARIDRRLLSGIDVLHWIGRAPRGVLELVEAAYLGCFLFVPAGMAILAIAGQTASADRFWTLVLIAEFGSFGMLPWIQTRPPRAIESLDALERRPLVMRSVNRFMVRHTSIGANTFPSGHVAGALATAIGVAGAVPAVAPEVTIAALAITIATVVGRYHYAMDAVAGAALALGAWATVRAIGL